MSAVLLGLLGCSAAPEPQPPADPRPALGDPLPCAPGCAGAEAARRGLARAVDWLSAAVATREALPLNVDVLATTLPISARWRSEPLDALVAAARPRVDRPGEPRRRLYDPTARLAENPSSWWEALPGKEAHPSQILVEVLYCPEHGLRASTVRWLCEDFRDGGGPRSGHGAWYQTLAVDAGCLPRSETCLDALSDELVQAARTEPAPETTEQRDRLAEQILFALLANSPPAPLDEAVERLLASQQPDGAFAASPTPPAESDRSSLHATLVGAWALSEWLARRP